MNVEIENQKVLIEYLESEMRVGYLEKYPTQWAVDRGYIATTKYRNLCGCEETDGVEFVVLDDDTIAFRLSGDNRADEQWELDTPERFVQIVLDDAKNFLDVMVEIESE